MMEMMQRIEDDKKRANAKRFFEAHLFPLKDLEGLSHHSRGNNDYCRMPNFTR
jgi:hypothetical protein